MAQIIGRGGTYGGPVVRENCDCDVLPLGLPRHRKDDNKAEWSVLVAVGGEERQHSIRLGPSGKVR